MPIWVILIIAFLIVDFIFVLWIFIKRARGRKFGAQENQYIRSHWIRIIDTFNANPGQSIMDADKILYYALEKKGFQGNVGDKLKASASLFTDLDSVWRAHKLRNRIAHELSSVEPREAKRALAFFKRALIDLGADI